MFQKLKGVEAVVSGYTGGALANPSYEDVCSETTGHAEAIDVTYDPKVVAYDTLLEVFWKTHDATTPNRQGNDVGTRYRSAIFYHDDEQRQIAESYKRKLAGAGFFQGTIVTEIVPATRFYKAEDYHQNYFNEHAERDYCRMIIGPKLEKLRHVFADKLKTGRRRSRRSNSNSSAHGSKSSSVQWIGAILVRRPSVSSGVDPFFHFVDLSRRHLGAARAAAMSA